MNRTRQDRPGEALIEWGASACLAAAVGWSGWQVGNSPLIGAGALLVMFPAAAFAIKRIDRDASAKLGLSDFSPPPLAPEEEEILLLDDPLVEVAVDSRVASLFESEPATPGAMVARIADYLGDRAPSPPSPGDAEPDAGAALHQALANIRASLR